MNDGTGRFTTANYLLPELKIANPWGGAPLNQTNTWSGLIDVNMDGWLDMILGTWDTRSSEFTDVYLNNGNGSFADSSPISLPSSGVPAESVLDIKPIDLNGDDLPDLAISVTNGGDFSEFYKTAYVQLLVNQGDGIFVDETDTRYPQSRTPTDVQTWYKSVELVDINRDGYQDMVLDDMFLGAHASCSTMVMVSSARVGMVWRQACHQCRRTNITILLGWATSITTACQTLWF